MSKFNTRAARAVPTGPVRTTSDTARTYEGGPAYLREPRGELLLFALTNMVGEDTFYESATARDQRFNDLVHTVAVEDGYWMLGFVGWLRDAAGMRSASLVAAAEAVHARLTARTLNGFNRQIIGAALKRPDEPGEMLAYWTARHGRKIPKPVKRGVADAAARLYSERSLLKYDTDSKGFRFADVLELTHASPADDKPWQGELFKHAIDRRHKRDETVPERLRTIAANRALREAAEADPEVLLDAEALRAAGMTWEDVLSLAGPRVDKAKLWTSIAPSMGIMALIRNVRNFDQARLPDDVAEAIAARICDPEAIAASRLFPYRFLSAHRAAPTQRWGHALDKALTAATANVPALPGRTLVLVDTSGSMLSTVSKRSQVRHVDIGALFGVALAHRGAEVDLVGFANGHFRQPLRKWGSALADIDRFCARVGEVGHGTETVAALKATYNGHDRVVLISDMQAFRWAGDSELTVSEAIPADVPMFGVNTTGYAPTVIASGTPNRYEIGGFSDKLFTLMELLVQGKDAGWPWE
ncbi:TROVE domain-containing protein [Yinghuangia seranimata]|uniref:TROVE domain-containing protein n=1 Tax=Yinghuangia seranimata TaxID=408067 RepID=UPI00248AD642|nr:TROVE domain-containing protein [Yinghuangia seranimata]MDI2131057.1 TROVE domain-containing protein [Yinghuangia seranimata]